MIPAAVDLLTIVSLMIIGTWLEGVGGKHDFVDELLAPIPLGLGGVAFVLFERIAA